MGWCGRYMATRLSGVEGMTLGSDMMSWGCRDIEGQDIWGEREDPGKRHDEMGMRSLEEDPAGLRLEEVRRRRGIVLGQGVTRGTVSACNASSPWLWLRKTDSAVGYAATGAVCLGPTGCVVV